jgi:hypothetical protein
MPNDIVNVQVKGHVKIQDDLGNVFVDQDNAVHPENMARVISRALSDEHNYYIYRMAFGNGGTEVNAAYQITYNPVNDGQPPDTNTWQSRLYHETFSEIVDSGANYSAGLIGTDPGSADANTGVRPGGGSVAAANPPTVPYVSGPGVTSVENTTPAYTSTVTVICVLNAQSPTAQYITDNLGPTQTTGPTATATPTTASVDNSFSFDEIGLYTSGQQAIPVPGYQQINVGNQSATTATGLTPGQGYYFHISVNGGPPQPVLFQIPLAGGSGTSGAVLYGDVVTALITGNPAWAIIVNGNAVVNTPFLGTQASLNITNDGTFSASLPPAQTYGYLQFTSNSTNTTSAISISNDTSVLTYNAVSYTALFGPNGLNASVGSMVPAVIEPAIPYSAAGVQNDPTNWTTERERLLTHIIFSPVLKAANRTLTIVYTLLVSVARTPS